MSDKEFIGKFENHVEHFDARYVPGDPGKMIPQVALEEDIDLLVMGPVTRTGAAGLLIGRTAESVLQQVRCLVFGLEPEGFVTPLEWVVPCSPSPVLDSRLMPF